MAHYLALVSTKNIHVVDQETFSLVRSIPTPSGSLSFHRAFFRPSTTTLAVACEDNTTQALLVDVDTGDLVAKVTGLGGSAFGIAFTHNGDFLAVSAGNDVCLLDANSGSYPQTRSFPGHTRSVREVGFSLDDAIMITTAFDTTAIVWNVETAAQLSILQPHRNNVWSAVLTCDASQALTVGYERILRVWDVATAKVVKEIEARSGCSYASDINLDGTLIAVGGSENTVIVISVDTLTCVRELKTTNCVNALRFNSDGTLLCAAGDYGMAVAWATDTWETKAMPGGIGDDKCTLWGVAFMSQCESHILQLPMLII